MAICLPSGDQGLVFRHPARLPAAITSARPSSPLRPRTRPTPAHPVVADIDSSPGAAAFRPPTPVSPLPGSRTPGRKAERACPPVLLFLGPREYAWAYLGR